MALNPSLARGLTRALNPSIIRAAAGGGGPAAFDKDTVAGLELWLDAEDASTITGTASLVDAWTDKSDAGNDVGGTLAERPSQVTINSLNAIRFDSGELMELASASVTGLDGPNMTIFVVGNKQFDEADSWPGVIARGSGAWDNGWRMGPIDAGGSGVAWSVRSYIADVATISSTATGADAFHLWAADHEDTGEVKNTYLNNAFVATDTSGLLSTAAGQDLTVGQPGANTTYAMWGSIGEVLIYDSVLSAEDRLTVSQYLATKWGITLP